MDITFTEEQSILRDSLSSFLSEAYSFEKRRAQLSAPLNAPGLWPALANDLGILGAPFAEELGGLGRGPVDTMIIMEALGEHLVLEPFVPTVVLAGGLLRRSTAPAAAELIGRIIEGGLRMAFAYAEPQGRYNGRNVATTARAQGGGYVLNGQKAVVAGGPQADTLIVTARTGGAQREEKGISLFVVDAAAKGVQRRDYRLIDGRPASEIRFENVAVGADALLCPEGEGYALADQVIDEAAAAVCAEAAAILRKMVTDTAEYTKQRKQFGVPISSFQVLQHRMVDMLINAEEAASISLMAAHSLEAPARERAKAVSAAKAHVGQACKFVGQNAIQLHGGMGITDELAISHYFKRATVIETEFGSTDHHLARFADLALTPAAVAAAPQDG